MTSFIDWTTGTAEYGTLAYSVADGIATLRLNRPEVMNAVNRSLRVDLYRALQRAIAEEGVKVIVIAANGKGFSAGTDLQEASEEDTYNLLENEYKEVLNLIVNAPKPVIAAVHGVCAGVGASLALACDLVIMGEGASIYLAFSNIGLIPDGGMCWHLLKNMGYKHAYQVIVEGGRITAAKCLEYGLANKVVADDILAVEARQWAERLSQRAPLSLKFAKQVLQQAARMDLSDTMRLEAGLQSICSNSADSREGIAAFFEKRKPVFKGC